MMDSNLRKKFDADFKREAVLLTDESGNTVSQVAENLGIARGSLYNWRRIFRKNASLAFPGNGNQALTKEQKTIKTLEKELYRVQRERDILKKATAIFSRESL